ncbi:MAG: hypothetical protein QG572_236 [Pseudomonadota bacterium]|nr:hypothetical protein [Pseudomonadota bacterium]
MSRLCVLVLGFLLAPLLSAAEKPLNIPQSPEEMRKYMTSGDSRCPGCGVVSNVRQVSPQTQPGIAREEVNPARTGDSGPGEEVGTLTIAGTGSQSREARKKAAQPTAKPWLVTVRYDDGSYAAFEQDSKPAVRKGDRIQVVSGRVERR